jgi:glycine betaine catabolism B
MKAEQKYVFIAGGIGITPFRSMIVELLHKKQKCDIYLLYQARNEDELLFKDIFTRAEREIGLRAMFYPTTTITEDTLTENIKDYGTRLYFISGPQGFVEQKRQMLQDLDIDIDHIKTDLFSGYQD